MFSAGIHLQPLFRYLFHQLNHRSASGVHAITKFGLVITFTINFFE